MREREEKIGEDRTKNRNPGYNSPLNKKSLNYRKNTCCGVSGVKKR